MAKKGRTCKRPCPACAAVVANRRRNLHSFPPVLKLVLHSVSCDKPEGEDKRENALTANFFHCSSLHIIVEFIHYYRRDYRDVARDFCLHHCRLQFRLRLHDDNCHVPHPQCSCYRCLYRCYYFRHQLSWWYLGDRKCRGRFPSNGKFRCRRHCHRWRGGCLVKKNTIENFVSFWFRMGQQRSKPAT